LQQTPHAGPDQQLPGAGSNGSMITHWASVSEEEGWNPQAGGADTPARMGWA
jgi:hypothetical protein